MNERLDSALREWSRGTSDQAPPPHVAAAVMAEFDRVRQARDRVHWTLIAAAVAAALAVAVWRGGSESADAPPPVVADFVALPYVVQPSLYERTEVVRTSLPVAELIAAGLTLRADPGAHVQAEVLVGQDGRARAVRLVENFE